MFTKIAILGAGAIGLYYGARLALAGNQVHFLLRSGLDEVRTNGVVIRYDSRVERLHPASAFATAAEIGAVDLVFVTLKATANDELPALLRPLIREGTTVVTLQNGLGNEGRIAALVGDRDLLGGLCIVACVRTAPGEVICYHPGSIKLGEFGRVAGERTREVASLLKRAGIACDVVDNLMEARWRKLVWNIPFNGLSIAAGGVSTDVICADPKLASEVHALMEEVLGAASALGYDISAGFAKKQFDLTPPLGPYQPSSLVDYLAGRPVEVEAIWGEPLRCAREAGAAMPRLALLYALLAKLTNR